MNRKQRTILFLVVFWSAILGASGVWLWRADRQERLNRELIAAIKREDYPLAIAALEQGADGNARDEPVIPAWKRLWDLMRGRRAKQPKPPTALLLLLEWRDSPDGSVYATEENLKLVSALLAHGAQVNMAYKGWASPLYFTLIAHKKRTTRLLIEHGATMDDLPNGISLLALEIETCHDPALTEWMLQHGAKVDGGTNGWPPIASAMMEEDIASLRVLLRYHANYNAKIVGLGGGHLLKYAEKYNLPKIAKILRDAGAKR